MQAQPGNHQCNGVLVVAQASWRNAWFMAAKRTTRKPETNGSGGSIHSSTVHAGSSPIVNEGLLCLGPFVEESWLERSHRRRMGFAPIVDECFEGFDPFVDESCIEDFHPFVHRSCRERPHRGGTSILKPQTSNSNHKPQTTNLKPQTPNLKPLKPSIPG